MGISGEVIGVLRLDGLCICVMLVGLGFNGVSRFTRGDGVACVIKHLYSAFLPPGSLGMIATVCVWG